MAMAFNWFQVGEFSVKETAVSMNAVNKTTTTTDFIKLCKKHRMNFRNYGAFDKSSEPLKVPVIRRELDLNRLVIALVAYDKINPPAPYDGAHWVLMTGFDDSGVYFHDPYRNVDGAHIHMTDDLFDEALQVPNQQPYNGLALWP